MAIGLSPALLLTTCPSPSLSDSHIHQNALGFCAQLSAPLNAFHVIYRTILPLMPTPNWLDG